MRLAKHMSVFVSFLFLTLALSVVFPARSSAKIMPHVIHSDPKVTEIPIEDLDSYQKESIEEAKKLIPRDSSIHAVRVYQTPLGLWISISISENSGAYFENYETLRVKNMKPLLFYEDKRSIDIVSSHQGRLLLINDSPAVLGNEVIVEDLKNWKKWRLDGDVLNRYVSEKAIQKEVKSHHRNPFFSATMFSPDDREALLESEDDQYGEPGHDYKPWFYVVDIKSGKVLKRFKTDPKSPW